jgi:hypothetical protein
MSHRKIKQGQVWWLRPVILTSQEGGLKSGGLQFKASPGKKFNGCVQWCTCHLSYMEESGQDGPDIKQDPISNIT